MKSFIKKIINTLLIIFGFLWLIGVIVMISENNITGIVLYWIFSFIHFFLARNYIKNIFSKMIQKLKNNSNRKNITTKNEFINTSSIVKNDNKEENKKFSTNENELQKIPSTSKEKITDYLYDLKTYLKYRLILKNNQCVYICEDCNIIYPFNNETPQCKECNSYMKMYLSSEVIIKIPSRKDKYKKIEEENDKIIQQQIELEIQRELEEQNIINQQIELKRQEEEKIKRIEIEENNIIIEDFKKLEENLNYNNTEEILEFLFELEKLNDFYTKLPNNKKELFRNFDDLKISKIRNILNNKFDKIYRSNSKYDLYKSFIEELNYCIKRYPKYKKILKSEIIKIENCIEELDINNSNYNTSSLKTIDNLDGLDFEKYVYDLLKKLKYQDLKLTPASSDFGIDILATKDGIKYAIQCKNYKGSVGSESVQEAYSGKKFYNCHIGIVVTNNYFTNNAKKLAEKSGILLWDRTKLNDLINNVNND